METAAKSKAAALGKEALQHDRKCSDLKPTASKRYRQRENGWRQPVVGFRCRKIRLRETPFFFLDHLYCRTRVQFTCYNFYSEYSIKMSPSQ